MKALLILLFLLPLKIFAQENADIAGIWTGIVVTAQKQLPYELVLSEKDGKLTGYSYITFTINHIDYVAVKTVTVKNDNGNLMIEEEDMVFNNFVEQQPKRIRQVDALALEKNGAELQLEGTFTTKKGIDLKPIAGEVVLKKRDNLEKTKLILKLDELGLSNDLSFYQQKKPTEDKVAMVSDTPQIKPTGNEQIAKGNFPQIKEVPRFVPTKKDTLVVAPNTKITTSSSDSVYITQPTVALAKPVAPTKPKQVVVVEKPKEIPKPAPPVVIAKPKPAPPVVKVKPPVAAPPQPKPVVSQPVVVKQAVQAPAAALPKVQPKPDIIPAGSGADIAKRKIDNIQTLYFHADSLTLILYDNGIVDGDTVSVFLNGKVIMGKIGLSTEPYKKTVYITPDLGDSLQFVMYAENLGSIPPNTGLLIIMDGNIRHEIFFSGDLERNAAITLRRQTDH